MRTELPCYPWQAAQWSQLRTQISDNRLAHAFLLAGPAGMGKTEFATALAQALLCKAAGEAGACGACRSCQLYAAGNHPDLHCIGLEGESRSVRVDAVRGLAEFILLSSQFGGRRVGIIQNADRMNRNAANSLLKTLEEPPESAILILIADHPARLPATVRSRCQRLDFQVPDGQQAMEYLQRDLDLPPERLARLLVLGGGAPGRVRGLAERNADTAHDKLVGQLAAIAQGRQSTVQAASEWDRSSNALLLELLTVTTQNLIRQKVSSTTTVHPVTQFEELCRNLDIMQLHAYLDFLYSLSGLADRSLNPELFAEDLFIRWRAVCAREPLVID